MGFGKIPSHLSFSRLSIRKSFHRVRTEASKITMNCVISGYFNHRCSMEWHMDSKNSKRTTKQKVVQKISPNKKSLKCIFTFGGGKKKSGVFVPHPLEKLPPTPKRFGLSAACIDPHGHTNAQRTTSIFCFLHPSAMVKVVKPFLGTSL